MLVSICCIPASLLVDLGCISYCISDLTSLLDLHFNVHLARLQIQWIGGKIYMILMGKSMVSG